MDRGILYPGAIVLAEEHSTQRVSSMKAMGALIGATLGQSSLADGLACTPGTGMTVSIAPGSMTYFGAIDTTTYGNIPAASEQIFKQGINVDPVVLSVPAPSTSGNSIAYLIEAQFQENDTTSTIIPYYNSAVPTVPLNGPGNSGAAQYTQRVQSVALQVKAGTQATTGTQTTPSVDAGWTALYVVTVANGATTISAANIATAPGAPFIAQKLPGLRTVLTSAMTLYVAGTGNDANNGTQYAPFQTLQGAWNYIISRLDLNGHVVTVSTATGTYAGFFAMGDVLGSYGPQSVLFTAPSGATITGTGIPGVNVAYGAELTVSGFTIGGGSTTIGIQVAAGGVVTLGSGLTFTTASIAHIVANQAGQILDTANGYTISGNAPIHWLAEFAGNMFISGITITLTGTPAFSTSFANAQNLGVMNVSANTFSGSATGARYSVLYGGCIFVNGAGATYLPGNASGTSSGGFYN